jgi:hypothetical protein
MNAQNGNEREEFDHRLSVAIRFLAAAQRGLADARECSSYEEARLRVDRVMKALHSFILSARPPEGPPLL